MRDPLTKTMPAGAQGEFWYQLARRPITTNDEAFHALLLYVDGKDPATTYDGRVAALAGRHLLPGGFGGAADEPVDRGTLAVALDELLHIKGGLTMQVFGPSPRYALRAAVEREIFPPSSPNQGLSGGEFVAVMQRAEEYERGNPADGPAAQLPDEIHHVARIEEKPRIAVAQADGPRGPVIYADATPSTMAATTTAVDLNAGAKGAHASMRLRAVVTGVQGDVAEIRSTPTAPWRRARPGMVLNEGTEIRTGPKSAVRFLIPTDEAFCLDSQGAITLEQAVVESRKAQTRVGLEHGRLREDLSHAAPVRIEEAGLEHDTVIRSPNSALAIRGTKVSLYWQPSFDTVAVSLTGQAIFTNTAGFQVPVGGAHHAVVVGAQTSAAQQAGTVEAAIANSGDTPRLTFESRELAIVTQRGGFQRGDVIVGDLRLSDFGVRRDGTLRVPGGLDFVLQWTGATKTTLNDLNLAVFSPLNTTASPDFVANPPFTVSLTPNSPKSVQARRATYPQKSRSGGQITTNSVGPAGLELAFWPKNFPVGKYTVVVYNLVDAVNPPPTTTNPVSYTVTVVQNGRNVGSFGGTVGELQTSTPTTVTVPIATSAATTAIQRAATVTPAAVQPSGWSKAMLAHTRGGR